MTQTQTEPRIDQINTTAADEHDERRREINDQLTVRWTYESEGDPDVIGGMRITRRAWIDPSSVTLTDLADGNELLFTYDGSKHGVRWTATLDHYDRKNGGYADYDVEVKA